MRLGLPVASRGSAFEWVEEAAEERIEGGERGPRILSEQLNDYREICCRSAAIPKDGRVSTATL